MIVKRYTQSADDLPISGQYSLFMLPENTENTRKPDVFRRYRN